MFIVISLQAGDYVWLSYKEVYDIVMKVGNSIRQCGVGEVKFLSMNVFVYIVSGSVFMV